MLKYLKIQILGTHNFKLEKGKIKMLEKLDLALRILRMIVAFYALWKFASKSKLDNETLWYGILAIISFI